MRIPSGRRSPFVVALGDNVWGPEVVLAFEVLRSVLQIRSWKVTNTDDVAENDRANAWLNYGSEYDHSRWRYDSAAENVPTYSNGTRMGTGGQVWLHHGEQYVQQAAVERGIDPKRLAAAIELVMVQGLDFLFTENEAQWRESLAGWPNLQLQVEGVALLMINFCPTCAKGGGKPTAGRCRRAFVKAANALRALMYGYIRSAAERLEGRDYTFSCDTGSKILVLPKDHHWKQSVWEDLEHIRFVVSPRPESSQWNVQAIPRVGAPHVLLPAEWVGKSYSELDAMLESSDAHFCTSDRLILCVGSRATAVKAAKMALESFERR